MLAARKIKKLLGCKFLVQGQEAGIDYTYSNMIAGSAILFAGIAAFGMRKRHR